ncbi:MAG: hypothetical protein H6711_01135 [Myxococcales bacterium]|nr:hypothetical protein [Myxococcales bacterium]
MRTTDEGSATLLPEPSEIRPEAADKASSAARAAADRITEWFRRNPTGPQTRAASKLVRREAEPEGEPSS